jgi:hypothetical protein
MRITETRNLASLQAIVFWTGVLVRPKTDVIPLALMRAQQRSGSRGIQRGVLDSSKDFDVLSEMGVISIRFATLCFGHFGERFDHTKNLPITRGGGIAIFGEKVRQSWDGR